MPVVKADAYGHGAGPVSRRLEREGASILAVAVVEEGIELRRAGVAAPILVMGWLGPAQLPALVRHRLTPNVHSPEQLAELLEFVRGRDLRLPVHLKLDTGMTRLGVRPEQLPETLRLLASAEGHLLLEGVFQNFASSDEVDSPQTAQQARLFEESLAAMRAAGLGPSMIHVANSGAVLCPPSFEESSGLSATHVRPGLILYAPMPGGTGGLNESLEPVMSLVSVVDDVKRVPEGTRVGYGGTFVCSRPSVIAIVPGGYADGVPRSLSPRGTVLVHGRRCRVAGRISMDLTAVDVTDLPEPPRRGDEVVFFGRSGGAELTVAEAAAAAGTIPWEILCGVGPRVPRVFLEGGDVTAFQSKFVDNGGAAPC